MKAWQAPAVIAMALVVVSASVVVGVTLAQSPQPTYRLSADRVSSENCPTEPLHITGDGTTLAAPGPSVLDLDPDRIDALVVCGFGPKVVVSADDPRFRAVLDVVAKSQDQAAAAPTPTRTPGVTYACDAFGHGPPRPIYARTSDGTYRLYYATSTCGYYASPAPYVDAILTATFHGLRRAAFDCSLPQSPADELDSRPTAFEGITALRLCPSSDSASKGEATVESDDLKHFFGFVRLLSGPDNIRTDWCRIQVRSRAYVLAKGSDGNVYELRVPLRNCGDGTDVTDQLDHARGAQPAA